MKKQVGSLIAIAFIATSLGIPADAAVKAGSTCKSKGQVSNYQGMKYTCIKSGKKLVWNKGVAVVKPTPTPTPTPSPTPTPTPTPTQTFKPFIYTNKCQPDPDVPKQWKEFQENQIKNGWCSTPLRYVKKSLGDLQPLFKQDTTSQYLNISECKLPIGNGWQRDEERVVSSSVVSGVV